MNESKKSGTHTKKAIKAKKWDGMYCFRKTQIQKKKKQNTLRTKNSLKQKQTSLLILLCRFLSIVCTCPACAEAAAREEADAEEEEGGTAEEKEPTDRTDPKLLLREPAAEEADEDEAFSLESKEKRRLLLIAPVVAAAACFDALLLVCCEMDWIGMDWN